MVLKLVKMAPHLGLLLAAEELKTGRFRGVSGACRRVLRLLQALLIQFEVEILHRKSPDCGAVRDALVQDGCLASSGLRGGVTGLLPGELGPERTDFCTCSFQKGAKQHLNIDNIVIYNIARVIYLAQAV